jgi:alcohol dehydrogenase class IV
MRFTVPRDIYYGSGSLSTLKSLKGKKAVVVVGGSSMQKFGFLDKAIGYLTEAGIESHVYAGVEPDPSIETVYKGADFMRDVNPDIILSIGGGSPIDAAKAMWVFYEHPELTFEDIKNPFTMPELRKKAIFVAIPSTSGTATEVTAFSVITDYSTDIKYPLADFNITPDIAIVDPDLALTMPRTLTAHTGMDALTHATEAYVALFASEFTDPLALHAIKLIGQYLLASFEGDKVAREKLHYAQCLAGMAFSNALLGITHSMAHKTGAVFDIPHGLANAIFLPYVVAFNAKTAAVRYADIARTLGLQGKTDKELTSAFAEYVKSMNRKLGLPTSLKEHGVDEAMFLKMVATVSERAITDPCTSANPRPITASEMEALFKAAYYGDVVNF